MTILFPRHYRVFRQKGAQWLSQDSTGTGDASVGSRELEKYGLNLEQLIEGLFNVRVGTEGYYIVNLRDKEYYYCGVTFEDVGFKFLELGVEQASPRDGEKRA